MIFPGNTRLLTSPLFKYSQQTGILPYCVLEFFLKGEQLYFPAVHCRKRDNVATFPSSSSILNLPNLLKFTLLHAGNPEVFRRVGSSRCSAACWLANRRKSRRLLRVLRRELRTLQSALTLGRPSGRDIARVKWHIRRNRLKVTIFRAILTSESAEIFIEFFLSNINSVSSSTENWPDFMRNFFIDFGLRN